MKIKKLNLLMILLSIFMAFALFFTSITLFQQKSVKADAEGTETTESLFDVRELKVGDKFQEGSILEIVSPFALNDFDVSFGSNTFMLSSVVDGPYSACLTAEGSYDMGSYFDINLNDLTWSFYIPTGLSYEYGTFDQYSTFSGVSALDMNNEECGPVITVYEKRLKDGSKYAETPIDPTTTSLYDKVIRIRRSDGQKITFADDYYHFFWGGSACPLMIYKDKVYINSEVNKMPFTINDYYIDFYLGYDADVVDFNYQLSSTKSETENFLDFDFFELSLATNVEDEPSETPKDEEDNTSSNDKTNDGVSPLKALIVVCFGLAFMVVTFIIINKVVQKNKKKNKR